MISPGDKVKHYEIIKSIGKGGMGEVYLARDTVLDREVAIKFLPEEMQKDVRARERFLREAKSAAALDHPFICQIYETGELEGKAFIAMEYVEGENLSQKMAEGLLPLRDALQTTLEIAEALEVAHKKGIVHRDLKPANIMLTVQGHAKVMDFGLAKQIVTGEESITKTLTQTSLTQKGTVVGTIAYMSPEQARGDEVDGRSDIFALGIILHEMISGKNPFSKPTPVETLTSILRDIPPSANVKPKMVNPLLNPILRKALAKEPEKRYQTIKELIVDLRKAQKEITGGIRLLYRRLPLIAAVAVIVIALLVVVVLKFVFPTKVSAPKKGPEPISVLVADVQNKTGDSAFDILETTLGFSLDNASFISVYDNKQARQQAIRKKPASEGHLDPELAQLICRSIGINAVINSSIEPSNGGYLIKSWAVDSSTSKELAKAEQKISSKQDVLKVSDLLAAKLQADLVKIPPDSTEAIMKETFTTTSLEAMKAYSEAQELDALGKEEEAIKAYQRAIDHDPNFGRAYAGLAVTYHNRGDYQNTEKFYKEAINRIDQMTEREKHRTLGGYYLSTQNYRRAIEEYSALVKEFPKDVAGHTNLALAYFFGYRMPEAFQEGERAVELDPEYLDYRYNQSWYALASGDFDRARQEARKTLEIDPIYAKAFVVLALSEIAQDRPDKAAEIYRQLEALSPLGASLASTGRADLAVYEGRIGEAIAILEEGISSDLKSGSKYRPADKYLMLAQAYLLQGKKELAVQSAGRALQTYTREELQFAAAQIFIEAGKEDKARNIAGELNLKIQAIHHAYAKLIEGYLSSKRGEIANAIKLFDEAQSSVDTWLGHFALGRAYLEREAFTEAYSEFEKCRKRMGEAMSIYLVNDLPTFRYLDSLYYYIGRAQEGLGSLATKESYQKFLKIKEKADEGHLLVEDARHRLSKL